MIRLERRGPASIIRKRQQNRNVPSIQQKTYLALENMFSDMELLKRLLQSGLFDSETRYEPELMPQFPTSSRQKNPAGSIPYPDEYVVQE